MIKGSIIKLYQRLRSSDFILKVNETFITQILVMVMSLGSSIMVTRALGVKNRGVFAVVMTMSVMMVQFCNIGMHSANLLFAARDKGRVDKLLGNSFAIGTGFGSAVALIFFFLVWLFPQLAPARGLVLILGLIAVPLLLTYMLLQNICLGIQDVRIYNITEIVIKGFSFAIIGLLFFIKEISVNVIQLVSIFGTVLGIIIIMVRLKPHYSGIPTPSTSLLKKSIVYGVKFYMSTLFLFSISRVDLLIINKYLGKEQAGYYSLAAMIIVYFNLLPSSISGILFSKLGAFNDWKSRITLAVKTSLTVGIIISLSVLALFFVGQRLILFLYGKEFLSSYVPMMLLACGFIVHVFCIPFGFILTSDREMGYRIEVVYTWGMAFVINVVLNYLAVPKFGINGAAVVYIISQMFVGSCYFLMMIREKKRFEVS